MHVWDSEQMSGICSSSSQLWSAHTQPTTATHNTHEHNSLTVGAAVHSAVASEANLAFSVLAVGGLVQLVHIVGQVS